MLSHREKHEGWSGSRSRRKAWAGTFIVISIGKDKAQQEGFRLASVNHFSRLWGVEAISSYLVLDPGVMGGRGKLPPAAGEADRGGGSEYWHLDWLVCFDWVVLLDE